ncbi:hypothetical protein MSMTP_1887 [Methanosarcina sp. MTP4]|uniref:nucleotidyltransferase n=1 Tax=Methanosarcina sp. MTP4 TaxID=1434100 RepID=UPI000615B4AB|nr:DUF6036 family nucleotidyltransferase [Methanosarcina sp. MTP4]AKB25356.1 hypothetical protein MSMTP_1887 [Methanosarcina sp. MTP4]
MIESVEEIQSLFREIDSSLHITPETEKLEIFVIGGTVLLEQGLKPATKDIDLVVRNMHDFKLFENTLNSLGFKSTKPGAEYIHMNVSQVLEREDFRIDLFQTSVCGKFSVTDSMVERAREYLVLDRLAVYLCSNEDVFLFKTMTERSGDIEDCISLAKRGIEWEIILDELKNQIRLSGQNVWITWVGERLDILADEGLYIPILGEVERLSEEYYENELKKYGS